ncbi:MAG: hypothetical protein QXG98_05340 [Candidatus Micrarchaeia archaeon]
MKKVLRCHDCERTAEIDVDYSQLGENDWLECIEEGNGIFLGNDGKYRCEDCERAREEKLIEEAKLREYANEIRSILARLESAFPTHRPVDVQITSELSGVSFASRSANVILVARELEKEELEIVVAREYFYLLLPPELIASINAKLALLLPKDVSQTYSQLFWRALATNAAHKFFDSPLLNEGELGWRGDPNLSFLASVINALLTGNAPEGPYALQINRLLASSPDIRAMARAAEELLCARLSELSLSS